MMKRTVNFGIAEVPFISIVAVGTISLAMGIATADLWLGGVLSNVSSARNSIGAQSRVNTITVAVPDGMKYIGESVFVVSGQKFVLRWIPTGD